MRQGNPMFYGAVLLTLANLVLRLVSMSFQVYLSVRIGAAGIGLLQLILTLTATSFTVGSAGVRTCAMYLSAGERGRGRAGNVRPVLTGCFRYALVCAGAVSLGLWYGADWLAGAWIGDPAAAPSLRLYALFLPLRCLNGVLTGHFTAAGRIRDLVLVEFLEQGCAMGSTFLLLSRWAGADTGRACAAVTAGSCAGIAVSLALLLALGLRDLPRRRGGQRPPYGRILRTALPLGVTDTMRSGLTTAEHLLIPRRLALYAGTADAMADYGTIHGMVFPVLMFPSAILFSLAELLVPEFSRCAAAGSRQRVKYLTGQALRVSLLFSLCAGGVLYASAGPLGEALYHDPAVGGQLRLYAPFVPLLYTDAVVDAMCKGLGQQNANARYNTLTSFLDVVFLWTLLPRWGLGGYYASFAATHLVNFGLSLRRLFRTAEVRPAVGPPLRAAACAAAAALAAGMVPGAFAPGAACLIGTLGLWFLTGVIGREDINWVCTLLGGRGLRPRRG